VIDKEIADGDFPFGDGIQGRRIPRVREHLCGDTEAPFRSKGSGCGMATFLEVSRREK
jgi:hypothetical protein